jgi:hypothetical protein
LENYIYETKLVNYFQNHWSIIKGGNSLKKKKALLAVPLSMSLLFPMSAFADQSIPTDNSSQRVTEKQAHESTVALQIQKIKEHYNNADVQTRLINKVKKGEKLDNVDPKKRGLGVAKRLDANRVLITYPDGSETLQGIDFSEAKFYDANGNQITTQPEFSTATTTQQPMFSANSVTRPPVGVSGGTWYVGSGYRAVTGAKVYNYIYPSFECYFYTDFTLLQGGYDSIQRIYGTIINGADSWSYLSGPGIFRQYENASYSAYGGVKFQAKIDAGGTTDTYYLYVRVGGDSYWYDSNF